MFIGLLDILKFIGHNGLLISFLYIYTDEFFQYIVANHKKIYFFVITSLQALVKYTMWSQTFTL